MNKFLTCIVCVILLLFSNITVSSSPTTSDTFTADSVRISLLTCSSHPEVYSLYGHTAIRYEDTAKNEDYVINYGVFDFSQDYFVLRFAFGITDYSMGVVPFRYFFDEYRRYGSSITQQEINLTPDEKKAVADALSKNYLPENRVYRYNYFDKNCSTMARDIITNNIKGNVIYADTEGEATYREMIHACNQGYPWARLGNDMLLGMGADLNTTSEQRQFLPDQLMNAFETAQIERNGERVPLVKTTTVILQPGTQTPMEGFPLTPVMCSFILLALCCLVRLVEVKRNKMTLWFDALMMTASGVTGILIFIMFFSEHPTTSTNLIIFMLNPLPLFFLHSIYKKRKAETVCIWWKIWAVMNVLALLSAALLQDIDVSMILIALLMLYRALLHILDERKMTLKR